MSWTVVANGSATWNAETSPTPTEGRVLYAGMPLGLLLAITYDSETTIGWPIVSTTSTIWTLTT